MKVVRLWQKHETFKRNRKTYLSAQTLRKVNEVSAVSCDLELESYNVHSKSASYRVERETAQKILECIIIIASSSGC